ncbi:MAG: family 16 glycosylhydrolase [Rikenellaceae bacterium]
MKIRTGYIALISTLFIGCNTTPTVSYDWGQYPIPVDAPEGFAWELQPHSDDFNYDFQGADELTEFGGKWTNYYHGRWSGPAPTIWRHDHVKVEGGNLQIRASRPEDVEMKNVKSGDGSVTLPGTYSGCITSTQRIVYPAYIEARAKLSNSVMASDVWMLSPDDTQEIDIIEAYGSDRDGGGYGADRLHLSHHVFIRSPFQDYQPHDPGTWYRDPEGIIWRNDFHRVGVYWRDPTYLEYFVDGKSVRVVEGMDIIDPKGFTDGTGLTKEMDIIINMEDQSWRAIKGLTPTDEELQNEEDCTFNVDWIRVYKLVKE